MTVGSHSPLERTAWILGLPISADGKAILHALVFRVNSESKCWPSMARIGKDAGMSERKAREIIGRLERALLLSVDRKGGRLANLYRVNVGADSVSLVGLDPGTHRRVKRTQPGDANRDGSSEPGTVRDSTRHRSSSNPAMGAAEQDQEPDQRKAAPSAPSLWDLWAAIAGESKRSFLGLQIRDYGEEAVASAVAIVAVKRPAEPVQYLTGILRKSKQQEVRRVTADF